MTSFPFDNYYIIDGSGHRQYILEILSKKVLEEYILLTRRVYIVMQGI